MRRLLPDRLKAETGFSLVEVLIAITILLIAATAFLPLLVFSVQANYANKTNLVAANLAASVIEEIKTLPYIVKDHETGMIVADPTVPQVGTQGGNPPGSIPQLQTKVIDNITYTIRTDINWVKENQNPTAYKRIQVTVQTFAIFSGRITEIKRIHTLSAKEGEEEVFQAGEIQAMVFDSQGVPLSNPPIEVEIAQNQPPGLSQSIITNYDGIALFGMLAAGTYSVSAGIPENMKIPPDQILIDDKLVRENVLVSDWQTTNVDFYLDFPSFLAINLYDQDHNQLIPQSGYLDIYWSSGVVKILTHRAFFADHNFTSNTLPSDFIGGLWPAGVYSIELIDVIDEEGNEHEDYDMEIAGGKPLVDGEEWSGVPGSPGSTLSLAVRLQRK